MNLVKTFNIPLYGGLKLHLRVLENFDDFVLHKWPKDFIDAKEAEKTHATVQFDRPDAWLVLRYGDITHGAIAHEHQHLTLRIMRDVGMVECPESEEAYCYFMGWLAETIYGTLAKHKLQIK